MSDNGQDTFMKRFSEHVSRQDSLREDSVSTFQVDKEMDVTKGMVTLMRPVELSATKIQNGIK